MLLPFLAIAALSLPSAPQAPAPTHSAVASAPDAGANALAIVTPEVDLGRLMSTDIRSFKVLLKNQGPQAVQLRGVEASCGCTAIVPLTRNELGPGESVEIPITFDPHGFYGPVLKTLTVRSSDPKRPEFQWNFKANIETPMFLQPKAFGLTAVEGENRPTSGEFAFLPTSKPLKVKRVWLESFAANAPKVTYTFANGEVRGKVTLDTTAWTAEQLQKERSVPHQDRLFIETKDGYKDFIVVHWAVQGLVNVNPRSLSYTGPAGSPIELSANVNSPQQFKVLNTTASHPGLKATWFPGSDGRWISLRISWTGLSVGRYMEQVVLETDNPKFPKITVPVAAVIR